MLWDDRKCKLLRKQLNTTFQVQHRSRLRSFSNSNGRGRDCLHRRSTSHTRSHRGQSSLATSAPGPQTGRLLYVIDRESRLRFLVDTGSEVSIITPSKLERKNQQDTFGLLMANNSQIVTNRTCSLTLNLGLRRTFRCVFMKANVCNLILGTDFVKHYGLIVDMRCRRLLDTRSRHSVQGVISSSLSPSPTLLPKKPSNDFTAIMAEFPPYEDEPFNKASPYLFGSGFEARMKDRAESLRLLKAAKPPPKKFFRNSRASFPQRDGGHSSRGFKGAFQWPKRESKFPGHK